MADNPGDEIKRQKMIQDSMRKQLDIMKEAGIHHTKRKALGAEIVKLEEEILETELKQLDAEKKLTDETSRRQKVMTKMAAIQAGLVTAISQFASIAGEVSTYTRTTADTLGVSVTEAMKMNKEFSQIAKNAGGLLITQDVARGYKELEKAFGNTSAFTKQTAADMMILSKRLNISADTSAKVMKQMMTVDRLSATTAENTLLLAKNFADASNVKFSSVMSDVASSGQAFQKYFGGATKDMIRAAVEARKMGFELNDMVSMSQNLLDVEGRIEKQMKFNMLTGRQINLDKATALMLDGKQAEAMAEITAEVGDTRDLGILERQALDQLLGGKLTQLEQAQGLAEISTQESAAADKALADLNSNNELTARQIELANAAATEFERGKNAVLVQKEAMMALSASTLETTGIAAGLAQMQQLLSVLATVTAVANIFGGFGKLGPLGIAGAIAATAGLFVAINSAKSQATSIQDGMIGSDGGLMVSGPKGTFQLDKDDDLIAGTDLRSGSGTKSGGMDKLLAKMDALIAAAVSNKTISVDGYQLNEAVHLEKIPSGLA